MNKAYAPAPTERCICQIWIYTHQQAFPIRMTRYIRLGSNNTGLGLIHRLQRFLYAMAEFSATQLTWLSALLVMLISLRISKRWVINAVQGSAFQDWSDTHTPRQEEANAASVYTPIGSFWVPNPNVMNCWEIDELQNGK